jgi:protease-4
MTNRSTTWALVAAGLAICLPASLALRARAADEQRDAANEATTTKAACEASDAEAPDANAAPTDGAAKADAPTGAGKTGEPAGGEKTADQADDLPAVRIAHIRLHGAVLDRPAGLDFMQETSGQMTLRDWLHRLAKVRNADDIDELVLQVDGVSMTWTQAQELADAIGRIREAGKTVRVAMVAGGWTQYLVASAGDEVIMDPAGHLHVTGVGLEPMFFKGTMNLLGIEPQMIQVGDYKGAAEPFSRAGPSDELAGEYNKILDDLYAQMVGSIAAHRRLKRKAVREAIDLGPLTAKQAKRYGLVDHLEHRYDWWEAIGKRVAGGKSVKVVWHEEYARKQRKSVDFSNPFAVLALLAGGKKAAGPTSPTIAIVHIDGPIVQGRSEEGLFGSGGVGDKTIAHAMEQCRKNDHIKAVIVRINSPGGSAIASEMMYQTIRRCAEVKPVIASVGSMAASGGYYAAVGADRIIADPAALVGSIGVVAGKLAPKEMLAKMGISTHSFTRGKNAGMHLSRAWTPREKRKMRRVAEAIYDTFVDRVKTGRKHAKMDIDAVAAGRIFTARLAVRNGMVDQLGGLREAVAEARKRAGVSRSEFLTLPRPKSFLDAFNLQGGASLGVSRAAFGEVFDRLDPSVRRGAGYLLGLAGMLRQERVLTAMPCAVVLHH